MVESPDSREPCDPVATPGAFAGAAGSWSKPGLAAATGANRPVDVTGPSSGAQDAARTEAGWRRVLVRRVSTLLAATALVALVSGVCYAWAIWRYGSIGKALARLRGQVLAVERASEEIPSVPPKVYLTGFWEVENLTGRPVTIVGSRSACGCVVAEDLPMSLGPRARRTIRISAIVTPPKEGDEFAQPIQLCLDTPSAPIVAVVRAKVLQGASE